MTSFDDESVEGRRCRTVRLDARGATVIAAEFEVSDPFRDSFLFDDCIDTGDLAHMDELDHSHVPTTDDKVLGVSGKPSKMKQIATVGVRDDRLGERAATVMVPTDPTDSGTLPERTWSLAARQIARQFWPGSRTAADPPEAATLRIQKCPPRDLAGNTQSGTTEYREGPL